VGFLPGMNFDENDRPVSQRTEKLQMPAGLSYPMDLDGFEGFSCGYFGMFKENDVIACEFNYQDGMTKWWINDEPQGETLILGLVKHTR
jgi:hypothetical protein